MPPWMSFVERDDVPDAKSSRSTSATLRPRVEASIATPVPVAPPPMTSTSNSCPFIASFISARVGGCHLGTATVSPSTSASSMIE